MGRRVLSLGYFLLKTDNTSEFIDSVDLITGLILFIGYL